MEIAVFPRNFVAFLFSKRIFGGKCSYTLLRPFWMIPCVCIVPQLVMNESVAIS